MKILVAGAGHGGLVAAALLARAPDTLFVWLMDVTRKGGGITGGYTRVGRYPFALVAAHWAIILAASDLSRIRLRWRRPLPLGLILEHPQWSQLWDARLAIFYTGVFSCSIAYTLQIMGQRRTPPALASLIMSLESVFSLIFGVILLHETMSGRELIGCALMLCAVILSQLPGKRAA